MAFWYKFESAGVEWLFVSNYKESVGKRWNDIDSPIMIVSRNLSELVTWQARNLFQIKYNTIFQEITSILLVSLTLDYGGF